MIRQQVQCCGGRYMVCTFELRGDRWAMVRQAPASHRDIAQATMDDNIVDFDGKGVLL